MRLFKHAFARIRTVLASLALGSLALAAQAGTTDIYYHNDLAGTPMAATDGAGNLLWRQSYKPYGERLDPKAPAEQLPWYTGKAHVEAAGLSYFGARWYDPALGRFMGVDPVGFSESNVHSFNRYAYANNNPYKFVDPDGRLPVLIPILGAIAKWTLGGYAAGVAADAASQYFGSGSVDPAMAAGSDAAKAGASAGLLSGVGYGVERAIGAAAKETTTLYRAVNQAELKQVQSTNAFEAGTNSLGGKWFAESVEHARQWGNALNGKGASTILEVKLPRTQADQFMRMERLDGIGPARYGEIDQLRGATIRTLGQ